MQPCRLQAAKSPRILRCSESIRWVEYADAVGHLKAHHTDPFDRLIIAAAGIEGLTIVTSDTQFARYDIPLINAQN